MKNISGLVYCLIIVILSCFAYLPLLHSGFFNFHDNTQVVRVIEMGNSLSAGMFPVRWVADLGYGYGYPIFNFYGPLPYYIGGMLFQIGLDALLATKTMFLIGIIVSGISMFFLVRKLFGDIAAIACSVLYVYFPYHAVNIYVRGAVGEFFAYAFLPILFYGIFELFGSEQKKLFSSKNIQKILTIAFGLLLVAISHNLTFFMLLILLVPFFVIILFIKKKSKKTFLLSLLTGLVLGIALSAFYVLPAFLEMRYTNVSSQVGGGADFRDHFVCISQYWNSAWGYGGSAKGCLDGFSFKLGKFNILLLLASFLLLGYSLYKREWRRVEQVAIVGSILLIIATFLTLQISQTVWEVIPYMSYLQYPWRFINFIGFFMVLLIGYMIYRIGELVPKNILLICVSLLVGVAIFTSYKLFIPQQYIDFSSQDYEEKNYIKYTVSKISDEYMPSSFSVPRNSEEVPLVVLSLLNTTGSINVITDKTNYLKAFFDLKKDGVLHINRAYFPAWTAYENGIKTPIVPTHNGMNVSIHKGKGVFELEFKQTVVEIIANYISIVAVFLALVVIIVQYLKANRHKKTL